MTDRASVRRLVYVLLIVLSIAGSVGRIASVRSKSGKTPMLSANDRSRWAHIRALVDQGTHSIDQVVFVAPGKKNPEWYSIDMVKHRSPDGREHFYSSKPTLLTTLLAGPYWIWKQVTGATLSSHPLNVIRTLLVLYNVLPLLAYFVLVAWLVERLGTTDFGRITAMAAATFGTYLTTFSVTLNNHLPAAISLVVTISLVLQIGWLGKRSYSLFGLAGFFAAFTAANELPALSFFCLVAAGLLWLSPRMTLIAFAPAALVVVAGAVGTNYIVHRTWSTPYAHRDDGKLVATIPLETPSSGTSASQLRDQLRAAGLTVSEQVALIDRPSGNGWSLWDPQTEQRWAVRSAQQGLLEVREWDNWYEYEGSYWLEGHKQGVDRGEPSEVTYGLHALIGHHGIFSLTPLWFASLLGVGIWLRSGATSQQVLALTTAILTVVCLTFYIALRPIEDRNYGGVSCCFRWALWLIPLWLLCLIPAADAAAERPWLRRLLLLLLGVSVFSATYNSLNPWSHPWLFDYWTHLGWIQY